MAARAIQDPQDERDPAALAPREPRAWLDPLLALAAALGLGAFSLVVLTPTQRTAQMVRQAAFLGIGARR